jgi:hypothetical protein
MAAHRSSAVRGALVALVLVVGVAGASEATPNPPAYTATGLTPAQVTQVEWAMGLYRQAGLPLPPIRFIGHATTEPCFGSAGAQTYAHGHSTIHICTPDAGPAEQFLFVHELAHAWDWLALTDGRRAQFMAIRGLHQWRANGKTDWHELGAEHAAEIMVWGLMDRPIRIVYLPHASCAELLAGYLTLTGRPPLHGYTTYC